MRLKFSYYLSQKVDLRNSYKIGIVETGNIYVTVKTDLCMPNLILSYPMKICLEKLCKTYYSMFRFKRFFIFFFL